jgi:DNA-binding MarR family transcriptional regulator
MATLTPAEQDAWRTLVMLSHVVEEALDRQSRQAGGIPHAYYKLLVFLYEAPQRTLTMGELGAVLRHSPSRLAHAAKSLERSGWVARRRSADDRRVQLIELTEAGAELVRAVTPGQVALVRRPALDALEPGDVAALDRMGTAIIDALSLS